ncbi:hypothetical protein JTE90_024709 [Oedothorax gibbosus]|uniref:Uncharacterized protein n=1 Tax=Oedothorax gibbosus TaxID=931172 RepID=A0AAV6U9H1_9ARAC|nr:hypothetical protein JTE90_024709 [Oedothorax gibbosus]
MHKVLGTNVSSIITSMINLFSWYEDVLDNISSGAYATQQIKNHLLNAKCIGTDRYQQYCSKRLHKDSNTDIHSKITQQKLKTFSSLRKKSPKTDTQKDTQYRYFSPYNCNGQTTSLDMKYILTFNLNDFPPAIANPDGTLIHSILGSVDKSATCANLAFTNTLILDGMSILQQMQNSSSTFRDLAVDILNYIIHLGITYGCKSVHCDGYLSSRKH